jgi:hypothetical protein
MPSEPLYSSTGEVVVLCLVALLIGVSKAGFGGGTGILAGPLLTIIFGQAKEAVALMLPLLIACDFLSLYPYWRKWDVLNVRVILPGAVAGICVGYFALGMPDDYLKKAIGGLAVGFALLQVWRDLIVRTDQVLVPNIWHGTVVGFGTGFVSTLSHVGGTLTTMYLIPQKLDNERFVGTTTALYLLINVFKVPAYVERQMLTAEVLLKDAPLLPVVLIGTALGVWLNRRVPGRWFSRVVLVVVLVTGIKLLLE